MKNKIFALLIATSLVLPLKSNAVLGSFTWPAVAAAAILFGGAGYVDTTINDNSRGMLTLIGLFIGFAVLEDGRQVYSLKQVSAELAAKKGLSDPEVRAYNSELPVINGLMQSAGDSVEQAHAYLQANRGMMSPAAQSAMAKLFAAK